METEKKSMNRKKSEGVLAYDNSFKMERYEK